MSKILSALIAALFATVSVNVLADKHTAGEKPKAEAAKKDEKPSRWSPSIPGCSRPGYATVSTRRSRQVPSLLANTAT